MTLLVLGAQAIDVLADASFSIMTRPARPQDWEPFMYMLHTHNALERVYDALGWVGFEGGGLHRHFSSV